MKNTLLLLTFTLTAFAQAATGPAKATPTDAELKMYDGKWQAASDAAAASGDYELASRALHRLMECPSPAQPKGQQWNAVIAAKTVAMAQAALAQQPLDANQQRDTYLNLSAGLVLQAADTANMADALRLVKLGKDAYDAAMNATTPANDALVLATYAAWHLRTASRGGIIVGANRATGRTLLSQAVKAFNAAPDATEEQRTRKAWVGLRIATAFESVNDKNLLPFFEATIRLGDQAGAEGRCAANVARVHLRRPITRY